MMATPQIDPAVCERLERLRIWKEQKAKLRAGSIVYSTNVLIFKETKTNYCCDKASQQITRDNYNENHCVGPEASKSFNCFTSFGIGV